MVRLFCPSRLFIFPKDKIAKVLYFTAYAHWDPDKKARHKLLVKALQLKGVEVVPGKFRRRDKRCRICHKTYKTFEEKQTDVNISVKLFQAAINDEFDTAVIVTGDSDLVPAVLGVKDAFPSKEIGLIIPIGKCAEELKITCDFYMKMKEKHLRCSQFPDSIVIDHVKNITLQRPPNWT